MALSSELVRRTQIESKSTAQRHRQRDLKTVFGKRDVMVTDMAQQTRRAALLENKAQESVRAGREGSNPVPHFVFFRQPLPPGLLSRPVRWVKRDHRFFSNVPNSASEKISQDSLTLLNPQQDWHINRGFTQ